MIDSVSSSIIFAGDKFQKNFATRAKISYVTRRTLAGHPPALRRINLKVSPALASAGEGALHRDPESRPESLQAFESQLNRATGGR